MRQANTTVEQGGSDLRNRRRRRFPPPETGRLLSGLVLALSFTTVASAQRGPVGPGPGEDDGERRRFQTRELHEEFDLDSDGRLDTDERIAARRAVEGREADRPRRGRPGGGGVVSRLERPFRAAESERIGPGDVTHHENRELYDVDILRTLFIEFAEPGWHEELMAFHGTDIEVPGVLTVDGRVVGEVGVSYRGNTSFERPDKKSFGISVDAYDDDLRLMGYRTLNLLNANSDPTVMREVLFSNIAGEYLPAPKANFVKVVVNGTYLGVYGNVQQINKDFTKEHHGTAKGVRWKVPPDFSGGGALTYLGEDLDAYRKGYELKTGSATDADWTDLATLCRVLRETPDEELADVLPRHLDIDEVLWFLALDNVFMDSDGYYSRGSDYYLFKDPDGVFHMIHYDNNETFGGGGGRGGPRGPDGPPEGGFRGPPDLERDRAREEVRTRPGLDRPRRGGRRAAGPPRDEPPPPAAQQSRRGRGGRGGGGGGITQDPLVFVDEVETRPVVARILSVPEWRARYLERVAMLAERELDWAVLGPRVERWRALLIEAVGADPFLGDPEAFRSSLDGPGSSLKTIAEQRRQYLQRHPALRTAPPGNDDLERED